MTSKGFIRNYGICKECKAYEEPIMQLDNGFLLYQNIYADGSGKVSIGRGII